MAQKVSNIIESFQRRDKYSVWNFKTKHLKFLNHIIIIGKQVIYTCRYRKIIPNFQLFLSNTRRIKEIEINMSSLNFCPTPMQDVQVIWKAQ